MPRQLQLYPLALEAGLEASIQSTMWGRDESVPAVHNWAKAGGWVVKDWVLSYSLDHVFEVKWTEMITCVKYTVIIVDYLIYAPL